MPFQPTFDPAEVLAPFSEDAPVGADPRGDVSADSAFLQMKDARAAARRKERALDVDADAPGAGEDWTEVAQRGCAVLAEQGKDLEVAAWLIEALVRVDGFAGLYTGYVVAEHLVRTWWETVFPLPDEDGNEPRLAPFVALNGAGSDGTLTQPIRKVPITGGDTPYSFWQYEQALDISRIADAQRQEERISAGGLSLDGFMAAVQQTPASFYVDLLDQITAATGAVNALSDAFAEQVGVDAPPAGAIRGLLGAIGDAVRTFAADKLAQGEALEGQLDTLPSEDSGEPEDGAAAAAGPGQEPKPANREQMLRQLLEIARFFRVHEPHSPISYTLEELVRRARLPLGQLMEELIVDAEARRYFYVAAGLRPPEEGS